MDDNTMDSQDELIDEALADHVRKGLMVEKTIIRSDGSTEKAYGLTEKGIEEARNLIQHLADEGKTTKRGPGEEGE